MLHNNAKLLLSFLLVAGINYSLADNTFNVSLAGQTCYTQPIDIGYITYSYTITVDQNYALAPGCEPTSIL